MKSRRAWVAVVVAALAAAVFYELQKPRSLLTTMVTATQAKMSGRILVKPVDDNAPYSDWTRYDIYLPFGRWHYVRDWEIDGKADSTGPIAVNPHWQPHQMQLLIDNRETHYLQSVFRAQGYHLDPKVETLHTIDGFDGGFADGGLTLTYAHAFATNIISSPPTQSYSPGDQIVFFDEVYLDTSVTNAPSYLPSTESDFTSAPGRMHRIVYRLTFTRDK